MVQPYLAKVDVEGESGCFIFGGNVSHAITKSAALRRGQPAVDDFTLGFSQVVAGEPVTESVAAFATDVLQRLPSRLPHPLYARVDIVGDDDGRLALLELELIEPFLFLDTHEGAARNFVEAVARWMAP